MSFSFKKIDKFRIIIVTIFLLVAIYMICDTLYKNKMFENTATVLGTLKKKGQATGKDGPYAIFSYVVNDQYYNLRIGENFQDSSDAKYYCIEYSIEDPSVARLARLSECSE